MRTSESAVALPPLRLWVTSAGERDIPRPMDAPEAHSEGIDSDHVLLLGSGPAVGWGETSHATALPGALARALSVRTDRGTDVDVVASPTMTARAAITAVEGMKLWRYEAIVVTVGMPEAFDLVTPKSWQRDMTALVDFLVASGSDSTRIILAGIPAFESFMELDRPAVRADRQARLLELIIAEASDASERTEFVPLPATMSPVTSGDGDGYHEWASALAEVLAPLLDTDRVDPARDPRLDLGFSDEVARQAAVDSLGIVGTGREERFDSIVALAKDLFGAESAIFTVIDHDREVHKAQSGAGFDDVARTTSFCATTITQRGAMVIGDASNDQRFRDNPAVRDDPHVRFYAGFPIEGPSGEPIGALCVFDPSPRSEAQVDTVLLRSLAQLIQAELRRGAAPAVPRSFSR